MVKFRQIWSHWMTATARGIFLCAKTSQLTAASFFRIRGEIPQKKLVR